MGTQIERRGCAVIGAGEILDHKRVAGLIDPGAFVICADGGYAHAQALGLTPGLIVGDFDSLTSAIPANVPRVKLSTDKDYTDSFYAAQQALGRGYTRLLLTGMTGGRLDHTLANLQLLARIARTNPGTRALLTDGVTDTYALADEGELTLPHREQCYFSVIALEPCECVSISGGVYPLENHPLRPDDPRAISNQFAQKDVRIAQKKGLLIATSSPIK